VDIEDSQQKSDKTEVEKIKTEIRCSKEAVCAQANNSFADAVFQIQETFDNYSCEYSQLDNQHFSLLWNLF
jgi:hypothetical protein